MYVYVRRRGVLLQILGYGFLSMFERPAGLCQAPVASVEPLHLIEARLSTLDGGQVVYPGLVRPDGWARRR